MFKRFRVQNFMCLKDVSIKLEPLTLLIGPNSSGKSALFKALSTFCKLFWYPIRGGRTGDFNVEFGIGLDDVVWGRNSAYPISFEVWFEDQEEPDYLIEIRRDYSGWSVVRERFQYEGNWLDTASDKFEFDTSRQRKTYEGPYRGPLAFLTAQYFQDPVAVKYLKPLQDLRDRFGQTRRYRPSASDIAAFVKRSGDSHSRGRFFVDENGRGLALVLRELLSRDREIFMKIEQQLERFHGHIKGINFKSDWRGVGLFYKTQQMPDDTPASLESDGVLLTTFLLWLLYSGKKHLKICLEEPENGIHISSLKQRYEFLNTITSGGSDNPGCQVLIATHSRDFLNSIPSRTDILKSVRITEASLAEGTVISELHHYREIDHLLDEFRDQLGDLWWSNRLKRKPEY